MDGALRWLVIPFIEEMKEKYNITKYYCSRKAIESPRDLSVRIYLRINESQESEILSRLEEFLEKKKNIVPWKEIRDEPVLDLELIQQASELALRLIKKYPDSNRSIDPEFRVDLISGVHALVKLMQPEQAKKAVHFVANNLGFEDSSIISLVPVRQLFHEQDKKLGILKSIWKWLKRY